jgi:hypothetical protein
MVTLPTQAAVDYPLVRDLVARGMDVARINCAHDDANTWAAMTDHVHRAARDTERSCRVCMDISGPRCRTGRIAAGAEAARLHVGDSLVMIEAASPPPTGAPLWFECSLPEAAWVGRVTMMRTSRVGGLGPSTASV